MINLLLALKLERVNIIIHDIMKQKWGVYQVC